MLSTKKNFFNKTTFKNTNLHFSIEDFPFVILINENMMEGLTFQLFVQGYFFNNVFLSYAKVGDKVKVKIETNPKSVAADPYPRVIKNNHSTLSDGKVPGTSHVKIQAIFCFYQRKRLESFSLKSLK